MENNSENSENTTIQPSVQDEMKSRLGSKYIGEGVTLTDNLSNRKFKIIAIGKDGLTISEIVSLGKGEESPISYQDLLDKFDKSQISVGGYEQTEGDKIIFHQVIREIMSGHTLADRDNAISKRDNEINELITEESDFKVGGVVGKIKYNRNGTVKDIRNKFGKVISEVRVGEKIYKRGEGTYNAIEGNELLRKEDADKIKIVKSGEKVKEKDKDKELELEESAKRIINNEIHAVQSSLVEKLLSSDEDCPAIISIDDIQNYYHYRVDNKLTGSENYMSSDELDTYKEKIQEKIDELESDVERENRIEGSSKSEKDATEWQEHLDELENLESEPQEIYEWWLISDWLKEKLLAEGEPIIDNDLGTWWGRTSSGQQIVADGIIQKIVRGINIEKYDKGKKIKTAKSIPVDTRYNGWKNYETWNVKLWIDNEQGSQNYWDERATEIYKESKKSEYLTKKEEARRTLSDELKDYFEENNPLSDQASTYSDLLGSALDNVDWREIAENLLEEKKECGGEVEMEEGGLIGKKIKFMDGDRNELEGEIVDKVKISHGNANETGYLIKEDKSSSLYKLELEEVTRDAERLDNARGVMILKSGGIAQKYEKGKEIGREFRYLKLIPTDNGLEIKLTKEGEEKVKEDGLTYDNAPEYFEDVQGNSEYIYHDDLGESGLGLTSAEGITDGYNFESPGEFLTDHPESAKVYWFPNYQIRFWGDILKDDGSVFFTEAKDSGGYMSKGGKVDITSNYYRFRQHSPKGVTECAVPQWAQKVAEATKEGAKITTCKKDGKWFVQSIMIPKDGVNVSKARKMANEIKSKFSRKKKALGGVAETCTCEDIEKTKNGLRVLINSSKNESEKKKYQKVLEDLN